MLRIDLIFSDQSVILAIWLTEQDIVYLVLLCTIHSVSKTIQMRGIATTLAKSQRKAIKQQLCQKFSLSWAHCVRQ